MGALDNITDRIKKDATKKASIRIKEAKKEADELLNKAKSELEKEKKALELETEKTIKIQRNRAISEARLEARKMKLKAKEEVITQAFSVANERLSNLGPAETGQYLKEAIKNAIKHLGSDVEVLCNPKDSQLVHQIASEIGSGITVSHEGVKYLGGAVIRAKNGTAQIDATFEGVLERMRGDIRREVAQILFREKQVEVKEE